MNIPIVGAIVVDRLAMNIDEAADTDGARAQILIDPIRYIAIETITRQIVLVPIGGVAAATVLLPKERKKPRAVAAPKGIDDVDPGVLAAAKDQNDRHSTVQYGNRRHIS
jgi:hypothetical protein